MMVQKRCVDLTVGGFLISITNSKHCGNIKIKKANLKVTKMYLQFVLLTDGLGSVSKHWLYYVNYT